MTENSKRQSKKRARAEESNHMDDTQDAPFEVAPSSNADNQGAIVSTTSSSKARPSFAPVSASAVTVILSFCFSM